MINIPRHKVFISYHHALDQDYKEQLLFSNGLNDIFYDASVDTGDISDDAKDEYIRTRIRDYYLRDSSVTVVLVGKETKLRKHIDWEIYSSMYDGSENPKSGILVINLPTINQAIAANDDDEKEIISPNSNWYEITHHETHFPYSPLRIIDSMNQGVPISVVDYNIVINNPSGFKQLIHKAYTRRSSNNYNLSQKMRRRNN